MAPQAGKISGPSAIRHLLTATTIYARTVQDMVAVIQTAIEEGALVEREVEYAKLLMALMAVERDLTWTAGRSRILLGEAVAEEGDQWGSVR
jgi:hypothetical protein